MQQFNECSSGLQNQELVWGKLSGHPWWPGILAIENTNQGRQQYRVNFFGDPPSHSILTANKIIPYAEFNKSRNSGRPSPRLKLAMKEAQRYKQAIEESKNVIGTSKTTQGHPLDNENTVISFLKVNQESDKFGSPNSNKQNSLEQILEFENNEQYLRIVKKKGRKPRVHESKKIHKNQHSKNRHLNKEILRARKLQVAELLNIYRLKNLPKPQQAKQFIDYRPMIVRKIFFVLRKNKYEVIQSQEIAKKMQKQIKNCSDFMKFISFLKHNRISTQIEWSPEKKQQEVNNFIPSD